MSLPLLADHLEEALFAVRTFLGKLWNLSRFVRRKACRGDPIFGLFPAMGPACSIMVGRTGRLELPRAAIEPSAPTHTKRSAFDRKILSEIRSRRVCRSGTT